MRTSLDIPDALFERAKRVALERKTTLRALVASGLEKELGIQNRATTRLERPPISLGKSSPLRRDLKIDGDIEAEMEAKDFNEVYR